MPPIPKPTVVHQDPKIHACECADAWLRDAGLRTYTEMSQDLAEALRCLALCSAALESIDADRLELASARALLARLFSRVSVDT